MRTDAHKLKPSKHSLDENGVASVVGTILALLVFLTILGIFINHYVPAMMAGNEHQHDETVISQMLQLKQDIDNMMLYSASQHSNTLSDYSTITLGSAGVPMFAAGTQGQLNIIPQYVNGLPSFGVYFAYHLPGSNTVYNASYVAGGGVFMNMPNRYYVQQSVLYENDAVIVAQQNGQFMAANPGFAITDQGGIHLSILLVNIATPNAQNITYSGLNSVGITSQLLDYTSSSYLSSSSAVVTISTPYPQAWASFFNSTMSQAGLKPLTAGTGNYTLSISGSYLNYRLVLTILNPVSITVSSAVVSLVAEE